MFYKVNVPEPGDDKVACLVTLNPAESRRLIAKATVELPEVKAAMKKGWIILARGITAAYVSEEMFNIKVNPKSQQTVGIITRGNTNANNAPPPCTMHVVHDGKVVENADSNVEILNFGPNDVFIKGANAIDPQGNAGIMASNIKGGTWGMITPIITGRNSHLIITAGLEKMVASVADACEHSGVYYYKWSLGMPSKLTPVVQGKIVTEIQALGVLAGVKAYHICSGGVGGSEGAVTLSIEGDEAHVKKAMDVVLSIKGEPPVSVVDTYRINDPADYKFDAYEQLATQWTQ
jgi:hypothetical protein